MEVREAGSKKAGMTVEKWFRRGSLDEKRDRRGGKEAREAGSKKEEIGSGETGSGSGS